MKITRRFFLEPLYWKLSRLVEKSDAFSRLFLLACLKYAVRRDALLRLMPLQVAPGSVVYDIGAHIGLYSIILAREVKDSFIYAFEPNPDVYKVLVKNINLIKLGGKITPEEFALSADRGKHTLYISSYSARSSFYELHARYDNNKIVHTFTVDCYSIDYLVQSGLCKPPDALKIDVEGHEYEVLRGARETLARGSPQIFVETHGGENGVPNEDRIKDLLAPFGYKFKKLGYPIWCYKDKE